MTEAFKYPNYDELAKWHYGRILWRSKEGRERLLANWTHPLHPHADRFREHRELIEAILASPEEEEALDARLRQMGSSLRAAIREIPSLFPLG